MKKILILCAALALTAAPAQAGGLLTNTNQNASFLRQLSQDGIIDITGMYANPAGTAFLSPGFHLSLNIQSAKQSRDITTTFPLFAYNQRQPQATHRFEGDALAPVIPSFHLSYNFDPRWSVNALFALIGGGGKCEFDQGLGTFEALYAGEIYSGVVGNLIKGGVPAEMAPGLFRGYTLDAYMKGRSYQFGLTLGATYKVTDNVAAFLGVRGIYATNNYQGWVRDISATYVDPQTTQPVVLPLGTRALELDADQKGMTAQPIVGVDWRVNDQWNLAMKFELPTRLTLTNSSTMNHYTEEVAQDQPTLGQFADGRHVREDVPGIIALGAQYRPVESLRLMAGWHYYLDKQAKKVGDKQDLIDKGSMEFSAGAEYDVLSWLTVSGSWQCTRYRLSDAYMNDLSFNTSSNAIGLGARFHISERFNIDFGYMHNFYHTRDVTTPTAAGPKTDHYYRRNRVFGLGANLKF